MPFETERKKWWKAGRRCTPGGECENEMFSSLFEEIIWRVASNNNFSDFIISIKQTSATHAKNCSLPDVKER